MDQRIVADHIRHPLHPAFIPQLDTEAGEEANEMMQLFWNLSVSRDFKKVVVAARIFEDRPVAKYSRLIRHFLERRVDNMELWAPYRVISRYVVGIVHYHNLRAHYFYETAGKVASGIISLSDDLQLIPRPRQRKPRIPRTKIQKPQDFRLNPDVAPPGHRDDRRFGGVFNEELGEFQPEDLLSFMDTTDSDIEERSRRTLIVEHNVSLSPGRQVWEDSNPYIDHIPGMPGIGDGEGEELHLLEAEMDENVREPPRRNRPGGRQHPPRRNIPDVPQRDIPDDPQHGIPLVDLLAPTAQFDGLIEDSDQDDAALDVSQHDDFDPAQELVPNLVDDNGEDFEEPPGNIQQLINVIRGRVPAGSGDDGRNTNPRYLPRKVGVWPVVAMEVDVESNDNAMEDDEYFEGPHLAHDQEAEEGQGEEEAAAEAITGPGVSGELDGAAEQPGEVPGPDTVLERDAVPGPDITTGPDATAELNVPAELDATAELNVPAEPDEAAEGEHEAGAEPAPKPKRKYTYRWPGDNPKPRKKRRPRQNQVDVPAPEPENIPDPLGIPAPAPVDVPAPEPENIPDPLGAAVDIPDPGHVNIPDPDPTAAAAADQVDVPAQADPEVSVEQPADESINVIYEDLSSSRDEVFNPNNPAMAHLRSKEVIRKYLKERFDGGETEILLTSIAVPGRWTPIQAALLLNTLINLADMRYVDLDETLGPRIELQQTRNSGIIIKERLN